MKELFEVGDEICSADGTSLGVIIGVRSTKWSDSDFNDVTYTVSTPYGRLRRYNQKDLKNVTLGDSLRS